MSPVVEYDERWPELFRVEAERIRAALGDAALAVEHVGSTAVPGLVAKPVVDIAVAVDTFTRGSALIEPVERLGYEYVPEYEVELPHRRYFRRPGYHVHMYEAGHPDLDDYLRFRDHLRTHPEVARTYGELKLRLAGELSSDRNRYQDEKSPFIEGLLTELRA